MSLEEVESFYRGQWPDFRLLAEEGRTDVYGQFLQPKGEGFVPSKNLKAIEGDRIPDKGIMFVVHRRAGLTEDNISLYPEGLVPSAEFCEMTMVNYRQK
jgi:hypothetical protein